MSVASAASRARSASLAHALALGLACVAACGGRKDEDGIRFGEHARPPTGGALDSPACVAEEEEVQGFAVDDAAIWRVLRDCRSRAAGLLVVREDRATGERRVVAEHVSGSAPVTLAGGAIVIGDRDAVQRVQLASGEVDELATKAQRQESDGASTWVSVDGGTSGARYAILRVGASGPVETVGTIASAFQMHALAASGGRAFVTLWSVCTGAEASCAAVYGVGGGGATKIADWPVASLGARLGPLAVDGARFLTSVGGELVEADAAGKVRTVGTFDPSFAVASLALGSRGRAFACLVPAEAEPSGSRVVEIDAGGGVREIAATACAKVAWSGGELFWERPSTRERYGVAIVTNTIGRARTD